MPNLDGSLSSIHTPDLVWGWDSPVIRKARIDEISAFVIKHAKWPAELDPSTCQTSELKEGVSADSLGIFTVELLKCRLQLC